MKPDGRWDFMIRRAARMSDLELARALAARERSCAWHFTDGEWLMLDQERGNRPSMRRI